MACFNHYCNFCKDSKKCDIKYDRDKCGFLNECTIAINDTEKDIIISQLGLLVNNIPSEEVGKLIYKFFYEKISCGTSDIIVKTLIKEMKKSKDWKRMIEEC